MKPLQNRAVVDDRNAAAWQSQILYKAVLHRIGNRDCRVRPQKSGAVDPLAKRQPLFPSAVAQFKSVGVGVTDHLSLGILPFGSHGSKAQHGRRVMGNDCIHLLFFTQFQNTSENCPGALLFLVHDDDPAATGLDLLRHDSPCPGKQKQVLMPGVFHIIPEQAFDSACPPGHHQM